jgi:tetratricopeptide (TPR) repeat protein/tRNA A-37 threonylcarbamoyl transferase component Bud32
MIPRARWLEIQSVFDELVDADRADLGERLDRACGSDRELRASVESLLKSAATTEDPLQHAVADAAETLLEAHRDRLIGTVVGRYRITAVLGQGGMSTVYRGEREDGHRQSVAIKVLQHTALHPRLRNRLHSERHILATLDHPSIARLIESGELDDGTPYLVMEHVEGEPIDSYCDGKSLGVRERLELFAKVCSAVHYAHRNLVVHRDIKPSNIFIAAGATPKLLDFGIAKLLAAESLSHTLPVTRLQERILTPENAAPEQVLGRPVTTATDIYALGVLLHQLLTGRSPYRLTSYSQLQLERAICMDDPLRPSQMVVARIGSEEEGERGRIAALRGLTPQRLRARLSGDLDAIVAMGMRKEPDRRYPSAEAMADDINRHLLGQPLRARQGDWRYNAVKFIRRHALGVVAAAAVFVGLVLFAGVMLWESHRIELARDATAQERDRAQQVSAFLVDVFSQADPFNAQGAEPTAKDLLDRGAQKITGNTSLQPEVRAQLLESIGLAYRRQGLSERAIPLFEQALAIRRQERPVDSARVAVALANLARALTDAGHLVSAESDLQEAVRLSQAGHAAPVETADILVQFGSFALYAKSDPAHAAKLFDQALTMYRAAIGSQNLQVAATLNGLADAAVWVSDYPLAERYEREALGIFQQTVSRNHPDNAIALATLGSILTQRGKYAEAEQVLNEALQIESNVFGADNPRIAAIEADLGVLYERQGDLAHAIAATQSALKITRDRRTANHYMVGYYLDALAFIYLKAGELANAEINARQALAVYAQSLPARHLYVASTHELLGEVLLRRGSLNAAEAELRTALNMNVGLLGADSWRAARSEAGLGYALIARDRAAEGEAMLVAARGRLLATVGANHPATQQATAWLVDYYRSRRRDADAARVLAAPDTR